MDFLKKILIYVLEAVIYRAYFEYQRVVLENQIKKTEAILGDLRARIGKGELDYDEHYKDFISTTNQYNDLLKRLGIVRESISNIKDGTGVSQPKGPDGPDGAGPTPPAA